MNKKGITPEFVEMVFVSIGFLILVIIAVFGLGYAEIKADATLQAENAALACKNNLATVLSFETSDNVTFSELAVQGYNKGNFTEFESQARAVLNHALGMRRWQLKFYDSGGRLLTRINDRPAGELENCETQIPTPCVYKDCKLTIEMVTVYRE